MSNSNQNLNDYGRHDAYLTNDPRHDLEPTGEFISNCCGAGPLPYCTLDEENEEPEGICGDCKEHCSFEREEE